MSDPLVLSRIFLARLGGAPSDMEQELRGLWGQGRSAWPGVVLAADVFVEHLVRCLDVWADPGEALSKVHARDVYLACACAQGVPAALAAFDRTCLSEVPAFVARVDPSPEFADEVRQVLREKLLLAAPGSVPMISEYAGIGPLRKWVSIAARRTAQNLRRSRGDQPAVPIDEATLQALPVGRQPELEIIKRRYQKEFVEALKGAFDSLSRDQRHVLRLYYAGGLSGDRIASLLGVHRATVVRSLSSARVAVLHKTRQILQERLRVSASELDSLIEMVRSQLDVSLGHLLKEEQ